MNTQKLISRALTLAVVAGVPVAAVAGPLTGVANAAPKPRALAPAYTTKPANPSNSSSATFDWAPPTGYTYACTRDGVKLSGTCTPPVSFTGLADGTHTFTVRSTAPQGSGLRPSTSSYSWRIDTVPPAAPSFTSPPPSPTRATSVSASFSDTDTSVVGFTCTLDAGTSAQQVFPNCTSPFQTTGLAEGTHNLSVAASDAAGNVASTSTSWVIDLTAPDVPVVVGPASPTSSNAASISFSTSDPAAFTCALDGTSLGSCTSPTSLTSLADGAHSFVVTATDGAGNASHNGANWVVDTTPPAAPSLVTGPADPTDDTSPTVEFSDSDATGLHYTCTVSDISGTPTVVQGPEACSSPYAVTTATTDGHRYQLHVLPIDGAGNVGAPLDVAWTLDLSLTPSPAAFTGAPSTPSNVTQPTFTFIAPDAGQTGGATGFLCALDTTTYTACGTPDPTTPTTYTVASPLVDGPHAFSVETNNGSTTSSPVTWSWTVDTTPPPAPQVPQPDASTVNPTITFGDSDPSVSYLCSVDGGAFVACSSPWTPPAGLSNGSHTLSVEAVDQAGNTTAPSQVTFTVQQVATQPGSGSADTTAPTVTSIATPSTLTAAAVVTFSEPVNGLNGTLVSVGVTGTTTKVATALSCLDNGVSASCAGTFDKLRITPKSALVPGQHYTVTVAAGATHDLAGNASVAASKAFRALRTIEENNSVVKASWPTVKTTSAFGGSYVREHLAGATASWTFTGTSVTWWTVTGKNQGKAYVFVDGVRKATVDNYASATHYKVARTVKSLRNAKHTLKIQVLGVKGSTQGTGTFVSVDAFTVGKTRTNTPRLATTLRRIASKHFAASHASVGDLAGQTMSLTFRGTSVTWVTMKSVNQGKAAVYVDGVLKATIDNWASTTSYGVKRTIGHLADKQHTVKIVVLGKHHKGGKGNLVTLDRFTVG